MHNTFTLHCITWQSGTPMLEEVRMAAYKMGFLSLAETQTDQTDAQSHHALVLNKIGKAIGCARITPEGKAECMAVLTRRNRTEIETALNLVAMLNKSKSLKYA